jgi:hypothetical protein
VYIDAAYVLNATIQNAQIADLAVDDNKIASLDVGKLTAGELNVGSFIQSTNYVAGTQGWKIHGNGFAEFGAADIRGQLTAAQIDSRGLTIRTAAGDVILNAGSSEFVGNVTGTVAGTAASTVVNTANTANSTANTANSTANTALSGLSTKLNNNARNVLTGSGGLATGTLNWNSAGVRTSGFGVGITQAGLAAYNSAGAATFVLDGSNGNATFSGSVNVGSFTGYSWPPAGQGGAHLSQDGLLLGNFNGGGKYFQVSSGIGSGNAAIFTNIPAFIDTLNIQGNAVTVPQVSSSAGSSASTTVNFSENTNVLVWGVCSGVILVTGGCTIRLYLDGSEIKQTFSNSAGGIIPTITLPIITYRAISAGLHTITCDVRNSSGNLTTAVETTIVIMGAKR